MLRLSGTTAPHGASSRVAGEEDSPIAARAAVWIGGCVAAIVLIVLIIFMLQNTQPVQVTLFAMQGTIPLAIALLIAGVGVGMSPLTIGTIRIGQLRRRLSLERRG